MVSLRTTAFALFVAVGHAWVPPAATRRVRVLLEGNVQEVSLAGMTDHEADGGAMADSITRWLDSEWMPQEVHREMAESAKRSYIACRVEDDNEMMSIMMRVATDLEKDWFEKYDKDAFVNYWDVANYVSDYLTRVSGADTCDCSTEVH